MKLNEHIFLSCVWFFYNRKGKAKIIILKTNCKKLNKLALISIWWCSVKRKEMMKEYFLFFILFSNSKESKKIFCDTCSVRK